MKGQKGYVVIHKGSSSHWWSALAQRVDRWYTLHLERDALAKLSDEALKDIGMSRADIQQETERPFWSDPMRR
ncbi:DUF1127 domain-containing protein [Pseudomonas sp. NA-150]|uniref:DUF1127 domain-containing protein n=1 Tax=Pseudomonas sp. NA-150 TaxID=3367525 RepID=UPI0037C81CF9